MQTLRVSNLGPLKDASIEFGDLTVLVGPQATGKSLFLQLLKLLVDAGPIRDELKRFNLQAKALAESALGKEYRVFFFKRDGTTADISHLDPGAEDSAEAGWGGLAEFSGNVGDIVARVVSRMEQQKGTQHGAEQ